MANTSAPLSDARRFLPHGQTQAVAETPWLIKPAFAGIVLLSGFFLLQGLIPLGRVVQIGADEGFELAKVTLVSQGHKLYSEVWNDQPPLHTFLVAQAIKHLPPLLGARLVTTAFTAVLLASVFIIVGRTSGWRIGTMAVALLILSPGFLELSASCMLEIPALVRDGGRLIVDS